MKLMLKVMIICSLFLTKYAYTEEVSIKVFNQDSYQQILKAYDAQPLVLILWSITCSACLEEMALIQQIHTQNPKLNIIMLSVDGPDFYQEMQQIIKHEKLNSIEHWGFVEDNSPALRYAIDSRWYGELPRTYFFDGQHHKTGISGVLSHQQYKEKMVEILGVE